MGGLQWPHRLPKPWAQTAKRDGRALAPEWDKSRAAKKASASFKNHILARLSVDDLNLLKPDLEPVTLTLRQMLEAPNKPINHSYFIESGQRHGHTRGTAGTVAAHGQ